MLPISTFPRHDDYDEDEYILKTEGLRDTHSVSERVAEVGMSNLRGQDIP